MSAPSDGALRRLGELAAKVDVAEGGSRVGGNVAALLTWALVTKAKHDACGRLTLIHTPDGGAEAVLCPVHGRLEAPEWQRRPQP